MPLSWTKSSCYNEHRKKRVAVTTLFHTSRQIHGGTNHINKKVTTTCPELEAAFLFAFLFSPQIVECRYHLF